MRTTKSTFGLVFAALPVLYCGGLLLYLDNVRGAFGGLVDGAMGPSMLGLGALGLLFLVLFVWKVRRHFAPPAPPKAGGGPADDPLEGEKSDFDPDAAIARYLAKRAPDAPGPAAPSAPFGGSPAVRPGGFGRKGA